MWVSVSVEVEVGVRATTRVDHRFWLRLIDHMPNIPTHNDATKQAQGSLLPLWQFATERTRRHQVHISVCMYIYISTGQTIHHTSHATTSTSISTITITAATKHKMY